MRDGEFKQHLAELRIKELDKAIYLFLPIIYA